jgi:hypothetical protein
MTSNQIGSTPGAYQVEDTALVSVPTEGAGSPVVVVSAVDNEALKDEIRQELMANATSAQVLIVEVPEGQDDAESGRNGSSSRINHEESKVVDYPGHCVNSCCWCSCCCCFM